MVLLKILLNVSHSAKALCVFSQFQSLFSLKEENYPDWPVAILSKAKSRLQRSERSFVTVTIFPSTHLPRGFTNDVSYFQGASAASEHSRLLSTLAFPCKPLTRIV